MNKGLEMFLVVDDEEWQRGEISDILKDIQPEREILFAINAEEGLKKVQRFFFLIDLVFIKRHMYVPDDGLELIEKIKVLFPRVPISTILIDASPPPIQNPADGFLKKPFKKANAIKEIRKVMSLKKI